MKLQELKGGNDLALSNTYHRHCERNWVTIHHTVNPQHPSGVSSPHSTDKAQSRAEEEQKALKLSHAESCHRPT